MPNDDSARTITELQLIAVWQEVLETTAVDVETEFVDLGGDSLAAMMCISRVRRNLNAEIPLVRFFMEGATIANFALMVDSGKRQ